DGRSFVTREDMDEILADFVPPAYPHEIELQNLVAVLECTSKEMVPKRFQNLDRTKLVRDIREIKELLGERE
ncbi:MAG TPA: AAA family ATPase, partial [Spirochaetia bacterium]|nr:AAA family ATPase [Spirochaetia bacterium]